MKHSGLDQVSRNNSKTGNVFSASFEERVGCEEEFAKKFKGLVFRFFAHLDVAVSQNGVDCRSPGD